MAQQGKPIAAYVGGQRYEGSYSVEDGLVRVSFDGRHKTLPKGSSPSITMAEFLLAELVRERITDR